MADTIPSKERVKHWINERAKKHDTPVPTPEQIRRELGWELLDEERRKNAVKQKGFGMSWISILLVVFGFVLLAIFG